MDSPRVLVVLGTEAACLRGTLRGFMAAAHKRRWTLLHYHPLSDLGWLLDAWSPAAVVIGPDFASESVERFGSAALVSVLVDRSDDGVASAGIDEEGVAQLALRHLMERGLENVSTFRYDEAAFAVARERAFVEGARAAGLNVSTGWGSEAFTPAERAERPEPLVAWLRKMPKPCGIFTCTDGWGRTVARYAREAGLRVPEDIAIIGADNDVLECELISPALSSVMIPWEQVGLQAANLVHSALTKRSVTGQRVRVAPSGVEPRRSTEVLAIDDALVLEAVSWIRDHSHQRLTVPMVANAVGGGRQRLERRFRRTLDRTVQEEIRRAHVEAAKKLLATSKATLAEVAKRSGFATAALLNTAFQREVGTPPGAYRRQARKKFGKPGDD
jgi:LacI family transcriptional regulator